MGFWSKFAKFAIPAGAIAATVLTGGAASPLLGMAIGGGAGAAQGALSGGGWKGALKGAGIGGALGGIGGGALKGMGGFGNFATQATKYAPAAIKAAGAFNAPQGMGQPGMAPPPPQMIGQDPRTLGYLNPLGLTPDRRTLLAGMGTRNYG